MIIANLLFYIFSLMVLSSAVMVVIARNAVHSVLFLIFTFFNAAGLFVLLGAEFVAMNLVIVYVGAVAVLFLFVVMMLNIKLKKRENRFWLPYIFFVFVLIADLTLIIKNSNEKLQITTASIPIAEVQVTNTHHIGQVLYTDYFYPFQIAGLILLVAMISAITLTLRERVGVKKQNANKQYLRTKEESMAIVKVKIGEGVDYKLD